MKQANIKDRWHYGVLVAASIVLAGCQSTFTTSETFRRGDADPKILLLPPEILLGEVTAGGVVAPNAAWTAKAERHVARALADFMEQRRVRLVKYAPPARGSEQAHFHRQLVKLHAAVSRSIMEYQLGSSVSLPTKNDDPVWSIGPGVRRLGRAFNADYALFVQLQDTYTSGGRAVVVAVAAILFRQAMLSGVGRQVGFASLVDLKSGHVVWFNHLSRSGGDLREPEKSRETIDVLMRKFPS